MEINTIETLFERGLKSSDLSEKQQTVLRVSLNLFAEQGFDRTTTSQIADEAGVSAGTVFKQFKTKDEILAALINPFIDQVVPMAANEFSQQIDGHDFAKMEDFLAYIMKDRIAFAVVNQKQAKLFVQELMHNEPLVRELAQRVQQVVTGSFGRKIAEFKKTGQLGDWSVGRVIQLFIGTTASYVIPAIMTGMTDQLDVEQASQEAATFLARGLGPQ